MKTALGSSGRNQLSSGPLSRISRPVEMENRWRWALFKICKAMILAVLIFPQHRSSSCWALNGEGSALLRFRRRVISDPFDALSSWNDGDGGDFNPCSWFGVECSDGKVVVLNLKDLGLEGTLAPEIGKLIHIKSIIFRNNSFSGEIPKEIGELKELEVLDLGYNNFSGSFPSDLGIHPSLSILLLDNNENLRSIPSELHDINMLSEFQEDDAQLTIAAFGASWNRRSNSRNALQPGEISHRRMLRTPDASNPFEAGRGGLTNREYKSSSSSLLQVPSPSVSTSLSSFSAPPLSSISLPPSILSSPQQSPLSSQPYSLAPSPSPVLPPNPASPPLANPPIILSTPPQSSPDPFLSPDSTPSPILEEDSKPKHRMVLILSGVIGGSFFLFASILGFICCRKSKVVTVRPWVTGLSGQLQKAFVTGVPNLQRSELETACEDFSNIIGSTSDGTVYKGTLSSGVEIAVVTAIKKSVEYWSKNLEAQFRTKIDTLSKINHKNFVNLIGFCEEENPFTRMMVFEYAPNGTLFEHLHVREAEHLDWGMRIRIAMGIAYCLEYLHQLSPPIAHGSLQSSSIYLTEDYAAKISDLSFWNKATATKKESATMELLEIVSPDPSSNVYSFGMILFEMISGRIPYSRDNSSLSDWASDCLRREQPLKEMVDPTLKSFQEEELKKLFGVLKDCVHSDPKLRPTMKEVTARLKEITTMGPDKATPKLSPLWWAELEIMSSESS